MIRLARLSIRRPRGALTFWAIFAVVVALLGLGVSDSLSPSISVVPGSESSRAQALSLLPAAVQLLDRWSWWPTTPPGVRPTAPWPIPPIASKGTP